MGIRALRKLQFGLESTPGAGAAATHIWRGPVEGLQNLQEVTFVPEDVGLLVPTDRSYIGRQLGGCNLPETPVTFQQAIYPLMGGMNSTSEVEGSGMHYVLYCGTMSKPTHKTFTFEAGNDEEVEELTYAFCTNIEITGTPGEALRWSSEWRGRHAGTSSFTSSLVLPNVEEVLFSKGKLCIDPLGDVATIGVTLKSQTLMGLKVAVNTGLSPKFMADGGLAFSRIAYAQPEVVAEVTFEHNSTAEAEKAYWNSQATRMLHIGFEGSALTTPGTNYSTHYFGIDLVGRWESFSVLDELNGNDVVTGVFRARYNSLPQTFATFHVVMETP